MKLECSGLGNSRVADMAEVGLSQVSRKRKVNVLNAGIAASIHQGVGMTYIRVWIPKPDYYTLSL
jgi:hypothetical protein